MTPPDSSSRAAGYDMFPGSMLVKIEREIIWPKYFIQSLIKFSVSAAVELVAMACELWVFWWKLNMILLNPNFHRAHVAPFTNMV